MKKLLSISLALALFASFAHASRLRAPFPPEVDSRFNDVENAQGTLLNTSTDGLVASRTARVTYDVSSDGGEVADHALGVMIPAKAIIKSAYVHVKTPFTQAAGPVNSIAVKCVTSGDIMAAQDIKGSAAGSLIVLQGTGNGRHVANLGTLLGPIGPINSACEPTVTVAGSAFTAGKANFFINYDVAE